MNCSRMDYICILEEALKNKRKGNSQYNTKEGFDNELKEGYCRLKYNQMIKDIQQIEEIINNSQWQYDFDDEVKKIRKSLNKIKELDD